MNPRNIGPLKVLIHDQMKDVIALPAVEKRRFIVAGYADFTLKQLTLFRGDGTTVIAPFDMFDPTPLETPDFEQLDLVDYGQTIKLGSYEASVRSILIDLDPEYRRWAESIEINSLGNKEIN